MKVYIVTIRYERNHKTEEVLIDDANDETDAENKATAWAEEPIEILETREDI